MNSQNLVISFDYEWFLAKSLAFLGPRQLARQKVNIHYLSCSICCSCFGDSTTAGIISGRGAVLLQYVGVPPVLVQPLLVAELWLLRSGNVSVNLSRPKKVESFSVRTKPGFRIGNQNQDPISLSVSESNFFSWTKTFFSKISHVFLLLSVINVSKSLK